jgi:hypothetical protein
VITALSSTATQQLFLNSSIRELSFVRLDEPSFKLFNAAQTVCSVMPNTLHTMTFTQQEPHGQMQYAKLHLPQSLKHLIVTRAAWPYLLPEGLLTLHVVVCVGCSWMPLPASLEELYITDAITLPSTLPEGLRVLEMSSSSVVVNVTLDDLPTSITHLRLAETQTRLVANWPPQLQLLDVGGCYTHPLGELPATLTELYVRLRRLRTCNYRLQAVPQALQVLDVRGLEVADNILLSDSLQILRLDNFRTNVPRLPVNLKELAIGGYHHRELPHTALPDTLEVLDMGLSYSFAQQLDNSVLPLSLRKLYLCVEYAHSLENLRPFIEVHRVVPRFDLAHARVW